FLGQAHFLQAIRRAQHGADAVHAFVVGQRGQITEPRRGLRREVGRGQRAPGVHLLFVRVDRHDADGEADHAKERTGPCFVVGKVLRLDIRIDTRIGAVRFVGRDIE
ncbi:MAG: hypothetical protein ACK56I_10190, partial [bacterium]